MVAVCDIPARGAWDMLSWGLVVADRHPKVSSGALLWASWVALGLCGGSWVASWWSVAWWDRSMVELGHPRGVLNESWGPRGGIGDVQTTCKLDVLKKCIEDSVRHLLQLEGAGTATNVTLRKQRK